MLERPENPLVSFGKQLGRDEIYAAILSAVFTAVAYAIIDFLSNGDPSLWLTATVLPLVGPVLEKPGLVAHYVGEGVRDWRAQGGPLSGHIKRCLTDGRAWRTVRADVLYHDPAYTALMALGIAVFAPSSAVQVGLLTVIAFFGAVTVAALLEVAYVELRYKMYVKGLRQKGFETEDYYEVRYQLIEPPQDREAEQILDDMAAKFGLTERYNFSYEDKYFVAYGLRGFNHRSATLRFRDRRTGDGSELCQRSLQAVYTHPREVRDAGVSLYRCFPVRKQKHYQRLENDTPFGDALRAFQGGTGLASARDLNVVRFRRLAARDPNGLYVSIDVVGERPVLVIEIKVRNDLQLLKQASDFVAMRYPVAGTTLSKAEWLVETGRTDLLTVGPDERDVSAA